MLPTPLLGNWNIKCSLWISARRPCMSGESCMCLQLDFSVNTHVFPPPSLLKPGSCIVNIFPETLILGSCQVPLLISTLFWLFSWFVFCECLDVSRLLLGISTNGHEVINLCQTTHKGQNLFHSYYFTYKSNISHVHHRKKHTFWCH